MALPMLDNVDKMYFLVYKKALDLANQSGKTEAYNNMNKAVANSQSQLGTQELPGHISEMNPDWVGGKGRPSLDIPTSTNSLPTPPVPAGISKVLTPQGDTDVAAMNQEGVGRNFLEQARPMPNAPESTPSGNGIGNRLLGGLNEILKGVKYGREGYAKQAMLQDVVYPHEKEMADLSLKKPLSPSEQEAQIKLNIIQKKQRGEALTPGEETVYQDIIKRPESLAQIMATLWGGGTTPSTTSTSPKLSDITNPTPPTQTDTAGEITISRAEMKQKNKSEEEVIEQANKKGLRVKFTD